MSPHSNVCDDTPNTNDSLDVVIPTEATKEASAENSGSGKGNQIRWTIYSRDTETLPVPMIPPASSWISPNRMSVSTFYRGDTETLPVPMIPPCLSWISPKRMSVSTFTQVRTPKPSVSSLGPSKQQALPLDRALSMPFSHQDGASD